MAQQIVNDIWDITEQTPEDNSIISDEYVEFRPTTDQFPTDTQTNWTIEMRDLDSFMLMSKSFLLVKVSITKAAGGDFGDSEVALANGCQLFERGIYYVNSKIVDEVKDLHVAQLVRNMLEYSDDFTRSSGTTENWSKDTNGGEGVASTNLGFAVRSARTGGKQVTLRIPLSRLFGFVDGVRKVSVGTKHAITLYRNAIDSIIQGRTAVAAVAADNAANPIVVGSSAIAAAAAAKLTFNDIAWWIPRVKPNYSTAAMISKTLSTNSKSHLSFERFDVEKTTMASAITNFNWLIKSESEKISKVVLMYTANTNINDQTKNNNIFNLSKLSEAYIRLGAVSYPERYFTPEMSTATSLDHARLYNEMLKMSDKFGDVDSGSQISYEDFKTLYGFICFDVRNVQDNIYSANSPVDIRVNLKFNAALGADHTIYAMVFSERKLELDIVNGKMYYAQA